MPELRALALAYEAIQDRIVAVVNPGSLDSVSFWLTRRLALGILDRLPGVLEASSAATVQAPVEYRRDIAAFEREAAVAGTEGAMTRTDEQAMRVSAAAAELALSLSVTDENGRVRLDLTGVSGAKASGLLERAYLQRILHMIAQEVDKAGWQMRFSLPAQSPPAAARRRVN